MNKIYRIQVTKENYRRLPELVATAIKEGAKQIMLVYGDGPEAPKVKDAAPYIEKARDHDIEFVMNDTYFFVPEDLDMDIKKIKPVIENKKPVKTSVIILTADRKDYLLKVLDGFTGSDFELIIVDDNSVDGTFDVVKTKKYNFPLTYIYWKREKKFEPGTPYNRAGPARNLGARHAKGENLIFIDGDIVPGPDFISEQPR